MRFTGKLLTFHSSNPVYFHVDFRKNISLLLNSFNGITFKASLISGVIKLSGLYRDLRITTGTPPFSSFCYKLELVSTWCWVSCFKEDWVGGKAFG